MADEEIKVQAMEDHFLFPLTLEVSCAHKKNSSHPLWQLRGTLKDTVCGYILNAERIYFFNDSKIEEEIVLPR